MKRATLSALPTLLATVLLGQSWCPPGATWTYTHTDGWLYDGMARYQYIGDTVMEGSAAQIISLHTEGHFWPQDTVLVGDGGKFFTRLVGDRVDLWTGTAFDTLYNFAALPGDHWHLNAPDAADPFFVLTVQDTGHAVIDGIPLRYLVTSLSNSTGADTIIERLGSLPYHFVPWAISVLDAPNGPLRCYEDVDINYHGPSWPYGCASIAGIREVEEAVISIHPNPGTVHFELLGAPAGRVLTLSDAIGRVVHQQQTGTERTRINTAPLPRGLYFIRIAGQHAPMRWIKE